MKGGYTHSTRRRSSKTSTKRRSSKKSSPKTLKDKNKEIRLLFRSDGLLQAYKSLKRNNKKEARNFLKTLKRRRSIK